MMEIDVTRQRNARRRAGGILLRKVFGLSHEDSQDKDQ